ncbi:Spaf_1101 family AAA-like ATPase [Aerococcus tenax]|uniref:Spaf_1101 family AAA-like ATPase n=1 Tax=Aerococcus tenax TaxID=3078812 RepID=UPI0018A6F80C|nr:hypothetical protein [Aerococcus tenax]
MNNKNIINIYNKMKDKENKKGEYKKVLFHLHTPESYDFKFQKGLNEEDYNKLSAKDIYNQYIKKNFTKEVYEKILDPKGLELNPMFSSNKEFYTYLLLAKTLIDYKYDVVCVTDHQSLKGSKKLQYCVDELPKKSRINIVNGVEITCADKLHVVIIFEDKNYAELDEWLNKNIISTKLGIMRSAYEVIKYCTEKGYLAYIAHMNTSNLFNGNNAYSAGYKKMIMQEKITKYIGINSLDKMNSFNKILSKHCNHQVNEIIECDSHAIDEIPNNNMWIKMANETTKSLINAIEQFSTTVRYYEPSSPKVYIESILLRYNQETFLYDQKEIDDFVLSFSDSMNSFIGGRGTGKSTTLDIINFILTQDFKDEDQLYFFSKHSPMYLLFYYDNTEYMIDLALPSCDSSEQLLDKILERDELMYRRRNKSHSVNKVKQEILKKNVHIYKINNRNHTAEKVSGKRDLLQKLYDERYSINQLVELANHNQIDSFIKRQFFKNYELKVFKKGIKFTNNKGVINFIDNLENKIEKHKVDILEIIDEYNRSQKNKLRITYYTRPLKADEIPIKFTKAKYNINDVYDITPQETNEFLNYIVRNYSVESFIKMCLNIKNIPDSLFNILHKFVNDDREDESSEEDSNKEKLTPVNSKLITKKLFEELKRVVTPNEVKNYYNSVLDDIDIFSVEFNINHYEGANNQKVIFKDITQLSLGQKVVTILNLILSHGDYINNLRPVIIDQPEDNLDSRYIYKNLINQLRDLKEKRQVIIATHNSTIVTNSLSEKVIVMNSDGENGWVKREGYVLDQKIKKEIVAILEGGQESFLHRYKIFSSTFD